ncbi:DUF6884 domain-containing protein [Streptomyces sp. NBC_01233]|uniref:DUF6884 domain-containing protein n=1 Tax=Streptomyces sp. NBC_01233 TaxID=2903787 RepID=UPI002E155770|nr:DUF6884 domain-containing protein [Streptomyces sp. NBC_01233]
MTAPRTPAVAVARELRHLGLTQGAGKDFRVAGHYANGERTHTYVLLLTRHANEVVAANADLIEERTAEGPFPFRVSVRYFGTDRPTASVANAGDRVRETPATAEEPAPVVEEEPAEEAELWDGVDGIVMRPGVLVPGVHVECLPEHRPGPRTRYAHGGVVQSVGTTCVRWRPYGYDRDVRTPLEHMRVDACAHLNMREDVKRNIAALNADRPLPRHPEWVYWNLAQHVEHAAALAAEEPTEAPAVEDALAAPGPVVVIPCGAAKLDRPAPAGQLYTGSYHRACARAAAALTADGGTVLVLSALYGLTPLDRVIDPYDLRMGEAGSITPEQLREQARTLGLDQAAEVVILAGATYTAAALEVWPHASTPLAGLGGMGYQLQHLAAVAAGDRLPAPAAPAPLPVSETPREELPTPHAPAEQLQIPAPAVDYREQHRQEQQAKGLGWSTRHADAVRWAAAGELLRAEDGSARRVAPGRSGRRVAAALLPPLVAAGFLADVERDGVTRVEPTEDGRRALLVWDLHRPEPVERARKKEGLPLRPLLGGREAARRSAAFRADEERRAVERERWYAEFEQRQAAEAWEDRLWDAWARVAGITYRLGRKRPQGWAPTDEEVRLHGLDAEVVAALRAEAPAAVEEEHPADGERPRSHPDTPHASPRCNLTLQHESASIGVSGRADSPTRKGNGHEPHDPDYLHRGRRRGDRRTDDPRDRGGRAPGPRPGDGRPDHHLGRGPGHHPDRVQPADRQRRDPEGRRDRRGTEPDRPLLQLGRHPDRRGRARRPGGDHRRPERRPAPHARHVRRHVAPGARQPDAPGAGHHQRVRAPRVRRARHRRRLRQGRPGHLLPPGLRLPGPRPQLTAPGPRRSPTGEGDGARPPPHQHPPGGPPCAPSPPTPCPASPAPPPPA